MRINFVCVLQMSQDKEIPVDSVLIPKPIWTVHFCSRLAAFSSPHAANPVVRWFVSTNRKGGSRTEIKVM